MSAHHPLLVAVFGLLLTLAACASSKAAPAAAAPTAAAETLPAWLTTLIEKQAAQPVTNPPASVLRSTYQGQVVYYLPAKCCDFPSRLLDAEGKFLCSPDGGITGRGDMRCPDFRSTRSEPQLIWQDKREK